MDVLTKAQRRRNMAAIRGKDTSPERVVRSLLHRLGFRYRLHQSDLPGTPDIVFPARQKAIFVHGCFWHVHNCKYGKVKPTTNADFWLEKRSGNKSRDRRTMRALRRRRWKVMVVWECWLRRSDILQKRILQFLS